MAALLHFSCGEERDMDLLAITMTLMLSVLLGLVAARAMLSAVLHLMARPRLGRVGSVGQVGELHEVA
jgi:hypothetical protein